LISEPDIPKTIWTIWTTPFCHFEYLVVPFRLTNTPATLQTLMVSLLGHLIFFYLDDILIFSKTKSEHEEHLNRVLQILKDNHLRAKSSKCLFFQERTSNSWDMTWLPVQSAGFHLCSKKLSHSPPPRMSKLCIWTNCWPRSNCTFGLKNARNASTLDETIRSLNPWWVSMILTYRNGSKLTLRICYWVSLVPSIQMAGTKLSTYPIQWLHLKRVIHSKVKSYLLWHVLSRSAETISSAWKLQPTRISPHFFGGKQTEISQGGNPTGTQVFASFHSKLYSALDKETSSLCTIENGVPRVTLCHCPLVVTKTRDMHPANKCFGNINKFLWPLQPGDEPKPSSFISWFSIEL